MKLNLVFDFMNSYEHAHATLMIYQIRKSFGVQENPNCLRQMTNKNGSPQ